MTATSTAPVVGNKMVFSIRPIVDFVPATYQVTLKVVFSPLFGFGVNLLKPLVCRCNASPKLRSKHVPNQDIQR
jgi:hypothetical protein